MRNISSIKRNLSNLKRQINILKIIAKSIKYLKINPINLPILLKFHNHPKMNRKKHIK